MTHVPGRLSFAGGVRGSPPKEGHHGARHPGFARVRHGLDGGAEVCRIFCATSNAVEVIVARTGRGRGILGVVDGEPPLGVEQEQDVRERKELLRKIGYKL